MLTNFNKNRRFGAGKKRFIYSKKTYGNPFFRRPRTSLSATNRFLPDKVKLISFALTIALLILFWLLFFSALFKIKQIKVSGVGESQAKEVESLARELTVNRLVGKNNLLLYDKSELSRILNEKYYLENLNIEKKLFHTLKITLAEKRQSVIWREDDKYFYLDTQGNVINQVDPLNLSGTNLPLIENLTKIKIESRQANINAPTINYVLALYDEFKDKKHGFTVERFILDKDVNTIKMVVLTGPKIYFNTEESIAEQAARLDLIIKEKLKDSLMTKEYINLRYGNNVYIK